MRVLLRLLPLTLAVAILPLAAQNRAKSAAQPIPVASSAEMQRLFDEDQADRQKPFSSKAEGVKLYQRDVTRRGATRDLLMEHALHTAVDFENAAFIFQHSDTADDYLLAHTLATIAVAKGRTSALWIAAATLDRYLHKIGQPQIYGTQFMPHPDAPWGQQPYNSALVPDALREEMHVPSISAQQKQLEQYNNSK